MRSYVVVCSACASAFVSWLCVGQVLCLLRVTVTRQLYLHCRSNPLRHVTYVVYKVLKIQRNFRCLNVSLVVTYVSFGNAAVRFTQLKRPFDVYI